MSKYHQHAFFIGEPLEIFLRLFKGERTGDMTVGTKREFMQRTMFFMVLITSFKYLLDIRIPSLFAIIIVGISSYAIVLLILYYIAQLNRSARESNVRGVFILLTIGVLIVAILGLP